MEIKVSIIVPVYNVEKYVEKCLNSLILQTLKDIEIICVNDASSDSSLSVLNRYRSDDRVKIINLQKNGGTLNARINGVNIAAGEYIMFVDGDDYLSQDACEKLYDAISREDVDIIHFGTELHAGENVSENMLVWVRNFLIPYNGRIKNRSLVEACFIDEDFDFNITNKIWKAEICKEAFSRIENTRLIASEDRYTFFLLMYYAKSYYGILDKYYHYNLGIGVTGGDILNLEKFEKRCSGIKASQLVNKFLIEEKQEHEYEVVAKQFANLIIWDCVDCWHNKLKDEDWKKGFDILLKYFSPEDVVAAISRVYFEQVDDIWEKAERNINKTIGIYYRYLGYDNMDNVVRNYANQMKRQGYDVIIYTDRERVDIFSEDRFEAIIKTLPSSAEANWDKYAKRAYSFAEQIRKDKIELVIYASPSSHICSLEEMLISLLGIPCLCIYDEEYLDEFGKERSELSVQIESMRQEKSRLEEEKSNFQEQIDTMKRNETSVKYMFQGLVKCIINKLKK